MTSGTSNTCIKRTDLYRAGTERRAALVASLPPSVQDALAGWDTIATVLVVRGGDPLTMIVDGEWIAMARDAAAVDPALVAGVPLPTASLLAVVANWPEQWLETDWALHVPHLAGGVLRLEPV